VSYATITLYVASQLVFIVVYFVIDSVRKLLDTLSYPNFEYTVSLSSKTRFGNRNHGFWQPGKTSYVRRNNQCAHGTCVCVLSVVLAKSRERRTNH
jgi:hypothetical protein